MSRLLLLTPRRETWIWTPQHPLMSDYTKCYYASNMHFLSLMHAELNKEFNGTTFKAIFVVCLDQLAKNAKHVF